MTDFTTYPPYWNVITNQPFLDSDLVEGVEPKDIHQPRIICINAWEIDDEVLSALQYHGFLPTEVDMNDIDLDGDEEIIYVNSTLGIELMRLQRTNTPPYE